ncbi:MAG: CDF family Co(II)/Ni(II) efflux transporter DmeF [Sulfuricurvum sp.]|uniref:CDF family Co(II)/Ni(II) efflux transporter DmeF n=1 Tax=Sulfuricurvum sp. TaxID=2025608 RepID=UPI00260FDE37|nr:CDF family Co(II)/Ni(II) efflux transporter DmeF [Sulfuricurvum sp.]MDD2827993.1 CDF family Co(II)/Ni(II) efflux transporter DmeF [Sulfuricurvum sp.]MDD4948130.1 CDF family Co(II)/Ni(II) efflux transporter DmeF [Sulfuricurvum sp.]
MELASNHLYHTHRFDEGNPVAERKTRLAVMLTAAMMVAEIVGGYYYGSMALLADGWHMSTHALALGLSVGAYVLARRYAQDGRFAFGTWKIEVLAGYTSALFLVAVALLMFYQSMQRLIEPIVIHYNEAIIVAAIGLGVNLITAWLLGDDHHHDHGHHHDHHDHDLNLRSAYLHVLADAATSVLAIIALIAGMLWGASWLDPVMGIVGGVLVSVWAVGLLRDTGRVLLDAHMDDPVVEEVREVINEVDPEAHITDLHVWRVGKGKYSVILSLQSNNGLSPNDFRKALSIHEELVHITVEINQFNTSL